MAKVDLVMVTWDRLKYTKQAIDSLEKQDFEDWHLTIVDNGSKDGTRDYLLSLDGPKIDIILWNRNKGLSTATDYVFDRSNAKYVGRLDNDTYVPRDWLKRCVKAHEQFDGFGFIGGMHFTPEQLENYEPIISTYNGISVWEKDHIGGCSFLLKRRDYEEKIGGQGVMGLTDYQHAFKRKGLVNGYLYPFIWVDHMEYGHSPRNIRDEEYEDYCLRVRGMATLDYTQEQNTAEYHIAYLKQNTNETTQN